MCGLTNDMIKLLLVIEFNLFHQITLHICLDIVGLLRDGNGDSGTIRLSPSDTTIATSKTAPFAIINCLEPPPTPPLENQSTPIVLMNDTTSKVDAPESLLTPSLSPLVEDALNNRSEESNNN